MSKSIYVVSIAEWAAVNKYKVGIHTGSQKKLLSRYGTALTDPIIYFFYLCEFNVELEKKMKTELLLNRVKTEDGMVSEWVIMDLFEIIGHIKQFADELMVKPATVINDGKTEMPEGHVSDVLWDKLVEHQIDNEIMKNHRTFVKMPEGPWDKLVEHQTDNEQMENHKTFVKMPFASGANFTELKDANGIFLDDGLRKPDVIEDLISFEEPVAPILPIIPSVSEIPAVHATTTSADDIEQFINNCIQPNPKVSLSTSTLLSWYARLSGRGLKFSTLSDTEKALFRSRLAAKGYKSTWGHGSLYWQASYNLSADSVMFGELITGMSDVLSRYYDVTFDMNHSVRSSVFLNKLKVGHAGCVDKYNPYICQQYIMMLSGYEFIVKDSKTDLFGIKLKS